MHPDFWHERWQSDQIAFHQTTVNATLTRCWPSLELAPNRRVLVPLAGKSHDLRWLAEQGHEVVGVELSPIAVRAFFDEAEEVASQSQAGPLVAHRAGAITMLQGDVLHVTAEHGPFHASYDRAASVALPPPLRTAYAERLAHLLGQGAVGLLITFDYPQDEREGPPFAVPASEVQRLYGEAFKLDKLESIDLDEAEPGTAERFGVSRVHSEAWRLQRR